MEEPRKIFPIKEEEMESLILKYMKQHGVPRTEAKRMICCNGFHKPKRLDEVKTPPNIS